MLWFSIAPALSSLTLTVNKNHIIPDSHHQSATMLCINTTGEKLLQFSEVVGCAYQS